MHIQEICLEYQVIPDQLANILDAIKEDERRWRLSCKGEVPAEERTLTKAKISRCKREGLIECGNTSYDLSMKREIESLTEFYHCLLYTSPSPRDATLSRMPSSA